MAVGSQRHTPAAVPILQEGWVGPRADLDGCEKSRHPPGIRSQDLSQFVYQIHYSGHLMSWWNIYEAISLHVFHCLFCNKSSTRHIRYAHSRFGFYASLYLWHLGSSEKATGLIWFADQKYWEHWFRVTEENNEKSETEWFVLRAVSKSGAFWIQARSYKACVTTCFVLISWF
jgi:hypothetical protein